MAKRSNQGKKSADDKAEKLTVFLVTIKNLNGPNPSATWVNWHDCGAKTTECRAGTCVPLKPDAATDTIDIPSR